MALGAFGTRALLLATKTGLVSLADFQGLAYLDPWRSTILAVSLIALSGLPPTAWFIGKIGLFWAILHVRFVIVARIGILTVILSICFKVVIAIYMRTPGQTVSSPYLTVEEHLVAGLILLLIFLLGLFPGPFFAWFEKALP
jgi:NADH-quinone oxidoreductase subunit N